MSVEQLGVRIWFIYLGREGMGANESEHVYCALFMLCVRDLIPCLRRTHSGGLGTWQNKGRIPAVDYICSLLIFSNL